MRNALQRGSSSQIVHGLTETQAERNGSVDEPRSAVSTSVLQHPEEEVGAERRWPRETRPIFVKSRLVDSVGSQQHLKGERQRTGIQAESWYVNRSHGIESTLRIVARPGMIARA